MVVAAAALLAISAVFVASAAPSPRTMTLACAKKAYGISGVLHFVSRSSQCAARGDTLIRLQRQHPVYTCRRNATSRGRVKVGLIRQVRTFGQCKTPPLRGETRLTLPAAAATSFCAARSDGELRWVRKLKCRGWEFAVVLPKFAGRRPVPQPPAPLPGRPPQPNRPPVANGDSAATGENAPRSVTVLANDTDADGDRLGLGSIDTAGTRGTATRNADGSVGYDPNGRFEALAPGETATDSFRYRANDGSADSGEATATVTIAGANDAPVLGGIESPALGYFEGVAALPASPALTVADVDSATLSAATVRIGAGRDGQDELVFSDQNGIAGSAYDSGTGVLTLTGTASKADWQTALRSVRFRSLGGASGDRSVSFQVNDGSAADAESNVVSRSVTVDQRPTAVNDAASADEDSSANTIDVLANDANVDGGPMAVASIESQPADGTAAVTNGGADVSYTPDANYCNTQAGGSADEFTYALNGGSTATVSVTVDCADDAPTAVDDSATVSEDSGANGIDVLANDTDIDGGAKSVASATDPARGTVAVTGGGTGLTYTPDANYCNTPPPTGVDTFSYTLDPGGDTADVSVAVTCVDDNPVAANDSATVAEDSGASAIDVLANDGDVDAGPKSVASVTQPANGTVAITGGGTGLSYTPNANYCNSPPGTTPDTFTYTLSPGGSTATVSVTVTCVDDAPTAVNDSATVGEDSGATTIDVLGNETDADGGPRSVSSVTQPSNGTVAITGGGTGVSYTPAANYCNSGGGGPDTFTYTLTPGGSTATVSVTVTCGDDAPTAVDDGATVSEDSGATAIDVLANDTDIDGGPKSVASVTQPTNGSVVITGGGTGLTYQPNANYCNSPPGTTPDTFTYTLNGGSTATVSVTVTCSDDPPAAVGDSATVEHDSGATAIAVLANDTDIDGGPKSIQTASDPFNGTVVITGGGTGLTYQPDAGYCGTTPDTFTYTLNGGSTATVSVTVTCDMPPTASADSATVGEDSGASAIDVLANDANADGGPKSVASVTQPANGSVVITGGGTGLTYQPNANYCNSPPGTMPDTFTYTLNGGSTATVSVTVTCSDDPPVAVNDSATVGEDSAAGAIDVLANDSDADGGAKTISTTSDPTSGTVVMTGGTAGAHTGVTYAPDPNYCNSQAGGSPDTFTYTLNGGSTATVAVTVTCAPDGPTANADTFTGSRRAVGNTPLAVGGMTVTGPKKAISGSLLDNDGNGDGGTPTTTAVIDEPTSGGGKVSIDTAGRFVFTPQTGCSDTTDSFTYTATNSAGSSSATATIAIDDCAWYVDASAAAGSGDGSAGSPFQSLASLDGAGGTGDLDGADDSIFLFDGTYTGGLPLENRQNLFGEHHGFRVDDGGGGTDNLILHSAGGGDSTLNGGLILASDNSVQGVDLGPAADASLRATSAFGTAKVGSITAESIANDSSGGAVDIDGGGGNVAMNFASISSGGGNYGIFLGNTTGSFNAGSGGTLTNSTFADVSLSGGSVDFTNGNTISDDLGRLVQITNQTGGTKDFNGSVTDGFDGDGTGVLLSGNSASTTTRFDGGLLLSTGANPAFASTGSGAVAVTDPDGAPGSSTMALDTRIQTTTGTALSVQSPIHADDLNFRSISSSGATNGISLADTGSAGGLNVTGDHATTPTGTSGGAISSSTGPGILLSNVGGGVSLTQVKVSEGQDDGIRGTTLNGLTMTNTVIANNGNAAAEHGVDLTNLTGSAAVTRGQIENSGGTNFHVANDTGTLNRITFSGVTIGITNSTTGERGINLETSGTANLAATIKEQPVTNVRSRLLGARGEVIRFHQGGTGTSDLVMTQTDISNAQPVIQTGKGGVLINHAGGNGTLTTNITSSTFRGADGPAVDMTKSIGTGNLVGFFDNNTVGVNGVVNSGSRSDDGVSIRNNGGGTVTQTVEDSTIRGYNLSGVDVRGGQQSTPQTGNLNVTILRNLIDQPGNSTTTSIDPRRGVMIVPGHYSPSPGDSIQACAEIKSNDIQNAGADSPIASNPPILQDFRVVAWGANTLRLPGYTGTSSDTNAVENFIRTNNATGSPTGAVSRFDTAAFSGGAPCPTS